MNTLRTYADLDLAKIRDACGLDFARHTYSKGQCSCCYGPLDMSAKYWAKGKKPKKINKTFRENGTISSFEWDRDLNTIPFILFKNADNGSGRIKDLSEPVKDNTCVEWGGLSDEQLSSVCAMLQDQLGSAYIVLKPENTYTTITIRTKEKIESYKEGKPSCFDPDIRTGYSYSHCDKTGSHEQCAECEWRKETHEN